MQWVIVGMVAAIGFVVGIEVVVVVMMGKAVVMGVVVEVVRIVLMGVVVMTMVNSGGWGGGDDEIEGEGHGLGTQTFLLGAQIRYSHNWRRKETRHLREL